MPSYCSHNVVGGALEHDVHGDATIELGVETVTGVVEHSVEIRYGIFALDGPYVTEIGHELVALPAVIGADAMVGAVAQHVVDVLALGDGCRLTDVIVFSLYEAVLALVPEQGLVPGVVGKTAQIAEVDIDIGVAVEVEVGLGDGARILVQVGIEGGLHVVGLLLDALAARIGADDDGTDIAFCVGEVLGLDGDVGTLGLRLGHGHCSGEKD